MNTSTLPLIICNYNFKQVQLLSGAICKQTSASDRYVFSGSADIRELLTNKYSVPEFDFIFLCKIESKQFL